MLVMMMWGACGWVRVGGCVSECVCVCVCVCVDTWLSVCKWKCTQFLTTTDRFGNKLNRCFSHPSFIHLYFCFLLLCCCGETVTIQLEFLISQLWTAINKSWTRQKTLGHVCLIEAIETPKSTIRLSLDRSNQNSDLTSRSSALVSAASRNAFSFRMYQMYIQRCFEEIPVFFSLFFKIFTLYCPLWEIRVALPG